MEKILFITNNIFVDHNTLEGGVKLCTYDYINLLKCKYDVLILRLNIRRNLFFRIKVKIGLDVYNDFSFRSIRNQVEKYIIDNKITKIFINTANASRLSSDLRKMFGTSVLIILCSHGNESGDFVHQITRNLKSLNLFQRLTAPYRLGRLITEEINFRQNYIDLVLTVSEIELNIEKWLGAENVYFVPRVYSPVIVDWNPIKGRVGFIADLTHFPNYNGIHLLCEEIEKKGANKNLEIRLVGKKCKNLDILSKRFSFVRPLGYLDDIELTSEVITWMFFLNLVFYYSKGVSTKLAKGMNWGLPIISTTSGNRGYIFPVKPPLTYDSPETIAYILNIYGNDMCFANEQRLLILKNIEAFSNYNFVMDELLKILNTIKPKKKM